MKKLYFWYNNLSKRVRDSVITSITTMGLISTVLSIIGISLGDWKGSSIIIRIGVVIGLFLVIFGVAYYIIGKVFRDSVKTTIRKTPVSIGCGDIFNASGMRVIGCDTHFDTRVDDVVISNNSLHGQLVLNHSVKEEIEQIVDL